MNLLNLTEEMGLNPKKLSLSQGGEYHCPCPHCGGEDRFMFWLGKDRYWCRQCHVKGDAIQFCRDFQGMSFHEARSKAHKHPSSPPLRHRKQEPILSDSSSETWQYKAKAFVDGAYERFLINQKAISLIEQRGFSLETIKAFRLGWNPIDSFHRRSEWGLEETTRKQWICLPVGIVIPCIHDNFMQKIKIRKSNCKEGDLYGKYYEVPGFSNTIPIFGDYNENIVLIVESELDAMLITQEAKDLCVCIALGGAQKRPDLTLKKWLKRKRLILFALDFDEAGKKEYAYWAASFSNLTPWPVPEQKSPGDYHVNGGSIREWISIGIKTYLNK
jgi:DNA primase